MNLLKLYMKSVFADDHVVGYKAVKETLIGLPPSDQAKIIAIYYEIRTAEELEEWTPEIEEWTPKPPAP